MIFVHKKIKEICQKMTLEKEEETSFGYAVWYFTHLNYKIWLCEHYDIVQLSRLEEKIPLGFFETIYIKRAIRKFFTKKRLKEELKRRKLLEYIN